MSITGQCLTGTVTWFPREIAKESSNLLERVRVARKPAHRAWRKLKAAVENKDDKELDSGL